MNIAKEGKLFSKRYALSLLNDVSDEARSRANIDMQVVPNVRSIKAKTKTEMFGWFVDRRNVLRNVKNNVVFSRAVSFVKLKFLIWGRRQYNLVYLEIQFRASVVSYELGLCLNIWNYLIDFWTRSCSSQANFQWGS